MYMKTPFSFLSMTFVCAMAIAPSIAQAAPHIYQFQARPPIHVFKNVSPSPSGLTPTQIKSIYHLPDSGGQGTIAIIGAFDDATIERDLAVFNKQFNLAPCTTKNNCFEKHLMNPKTAKNENWSLETSLDVEWAHAIAPQAKILLVEAQSGSGTNLLQAIDYAGNRADVVAVSMSWGGAEFPEEMSLDQHFQSPNGAHFFAASGDQGWGVSWPAVSPNVVAVGGTSLTLADDGSFKSESAWNGSGGGISAYEPQPSYQTTYSIARAKNKRAVPDVAYNADPASGFPVYRSSGSHTKTGWFKVGGTSAGAPQWAAIHTLGLSATNENFYRDKASSNHAQYFRDITSGANGTCKYYCEARKRYDYVTGLGSPLRANF